MSKLILPILIASLILLTFVSRNAFGASNPPVGNDDLRVSAQTTLSLTIALSDGTTVTVPLQLQMTTKVQNSTASMDVVGTVGEGTASTTQRILEIPAVIESIALSSPVSSPTTVVVVRAIAVSDANVRQGPRTNYAIVGSVQAGDDLQVVG